MMSDEEVMLRVARGDSSLFEHLVRRYATRLLTFLYRLVGDRHRAEELFQDVFLLVWTKRKLYKFPQSFRAWLYTIALNHCRATFRGHRVTAVPLADEAVAAAEDGSSPADQVQAGETAELVARAVLRLPPQQRAVVTLRIWEDLPYARIAEILSCAEGTVRSHMHHALGSLRRDLQHLGAPPGQA